VQSVPKVQYELTDPSPPSSQTPLLEDMQVSRQTSAGVERIVVWYALPITISAAVAIATRRWRAIVVVLEVTEDNPGGENRARMGKCTRSEVVSCDPEGDS